jgi:hypothetical protein
MLKTTHQPYLELTVNSCDLAEVLDCKHKTFENVVMADHFIQ